MMKEETLNRNIAQLVNERIRRLRSPESNPNGYQYWTKLSDQETVHRVLDYVFGF